MPDDVLTRPPYSTAQAAAGSQEAADAHDLGRFGYKQELRRVLGVYSSFAVAFSYISPSTGIFTLFAPIGLAIAGPFFFWSWASSSSRSTSRRSARTSRWPARSISGRNIYPTVATPG